MIYCRSLHFAARRFSSWLTAKKPKLDAAQLDRLFTNSSVQKLLSRLADVNPDVVFEPRAVSHLTRTTYKLMTEEELDNIRSQVREQAVRRLQPPPFMCERPDDQTVLSRDPEIAGHDTANFVFTDVTFGIPERERTVVVRQPDGVLRLASVEEHDRMNRIYYHKEMREVFTPEIFQELYFEEALKNGNHAYVLDWACHQFEPDNPEYIKIAKAVFDDVERNGSYEILHSTRHFSGFLFYLTINEKLVGFLSYLLNKERISEAADVVRLHQLCHPHSRSILTKPANDLELLQIYVEDDLPQPGILPSLLKKFIETEDTSDP